eukprot:scaffold132431_cov60-Phaeocystis_antarctica.AAC.2
MVSDCDGDGLQLRLPWWRGRAACLALARRLEARATQQQLAQAVGPEQGHLDPRGQRLEVRPHQLGGTACGDAVPQQRQVRREQRRGGQSLAAAQASSEGVHACDCRRVALVAAQACGLGRARPPDPLRDGQRHITRQQACRRSEAGAHAGSKGLDGHAREVDPEGGEPWGDAAAAEQRVAHARRRDDQARQTRPTGRRGRRSRWLSVRLPARTDPV